MRGGKKSWKWYYGKDHWMDCYARDDGLNYYGTNETFVGGGGYTGGFQTFKEFMENGGICDMPSDMEEEVREYIENIATDLPNVKIFIENRAKPYKIYRIFAGMDDAATKFSGESGNFNATSTICHFDGGLPPGNHAYKFAIQFMDEHGKVSHANTIRGNASFEVRNHDLELTIRIELEEGKLAWKYIKTYNNRIE